MSKSPEDDTASQATERRKTRASQMLGETDGGQEQVEGKERGSVRGWGREEKETQYMNTRKHYTMPPDDKSNLGTI